MKIEVKNQTINDILCKDYYCIVDIKDVDIKKNEHNKYFTYREKFVTDECNKKYFDLIKKSIPDNEVIIFKNSNIVWEEKVYFNIYTKKKKDLKEKERLEKKILEEMGIDIQDYEIDVSENQIKIDTRIKYNKKNLLKLEEVLDANDFNVIFDSHRERVFLIYYK